MSTQSNLRVFPGQLLYLLSSASFQDLAFFDLSASLLPLHA
jgi:hypothetical protein